MLDIETIVEGSVTLAIGILVAMVWAALGTALMHQGVPEYSKEIFISLWVLSAPLTSYITFKLWEI